MPLIKVAKRLPWQAVFQIVYTVRRLVIGKNPESVDHIILDSATDMQELRELFLSERLMKGDYASYYYYGEELNMVHGMHKDDEYEWYQYHVRAFDEEDGIRLRPHTELYWRVYPRKHIQLKNLDTTEGIEMTGELLEEAGIEYKVVSV